MTTQESIEKALAKYGADSTKMIVKRDRHPQTGNAYYYAISRGEKRLWASDERQLTKDEITELWYTAGCPPWPGQRDFVPELANLTYVRAR